jgi:head-tail adaptor
MQNLKDKKIILYKKETIKDSMSFSTTIYKPIHAGKLWAYFRQLSGNEIFASQTVQMKEEVLFSINWLDDLKPTLNFIGYKGVIYNITRVDTFEGYKQDLRVYASRLVSQPKPEEVYEWVEK